MNEDQRDDSGDGHSGNAADLPRTPRPDMKARSPMKCWPCAGRSAPGLITYYREPLLIAEGHIQYVWDDDRRSSISTPLPEYVNQDTQLADPALLRAHQLARASCRRPRSARRR